MTPLLTETEAAALLRIAPRTLRSIRASGGIRYVRPSPRKVFYKVEDCAEYIETHTQASAPPCHSTSQRKAVSGTMTSNSKIVAITALRDARRNATQNASKPKSGEGRR